MKILLWIIVIAALVAGCAPPPAPQPVLERVRPDLTAAELAASVWTAEPRVLRMRQTARFRFRGREVAMVGLMELDTSEQRARLVAVNEMGVKLFDLSVTEGDVVENYLLPELARYPRFGEAVAASLRRIFLAPRPRPQEDVLVAAERGYRLVGKRQGQEVAFLFGGEPVHLVEKSATGGGSGWRAVYLDYQETPAGGYPQEIVLEDRQAGYRLDLRIENVKRSDEPIK